MFLICFLTALSQYLIHFFFNQHELEKLAQIIFLQCLTV